VTDALVRAQSVKASFLATPLTPNTGCVSELKAPPFKNQWVFNG
jgi:hypothetical protein